MTKLRIQAQHLQPGDIVGSGEQIAEITIASIYWPSSKVCVTLVKADPKDSSKAALRRILWGKCTMINVEREEK